MQHDENGRYYLAEKTDIYYIQIDRQVGMQVDRQIDGWMDGWMDRWIEIDRQIDRDIDRQKDRQIDRQIDIDIDIDIFNIVLIATSSLDTNKTTEIFSMKLVELVYLQDFCH